MYRATDIAKWFIQKGIKEGKPLTPMQVLKLTYIAQCVHLAAFDEALFGESCEAWRYGPVVPAIYQKTRDYGKNPITRDDLFHGSKGIDENHDEDSLYVLSSVWKIFGHWDGIKLSQWTHRKGSAWDIAYNKEGGKNYLGYDIAADLLKKEFSGLLKEGGERQRTNRPGWVENANQ
jgi:uncharacterized phage-associated protein